MGVGGRDGVYDLVGGAKLRVPLFVPRLSPVGTGREMDLVQPLVQCAGQGSPAGAATLTV